MFGFYFGRPKKKAVLANMLSALKSVLLKFDRVEWADTAETPKFTLTSSARGDSFLLGHLAGLAQVCCKLSTGKAYHPRHLSWYLQHLCDELGEGTSDQLNKLIDSESSRTGSLFLLGLTSGIEDGIDMLEMVKSRMGRDPNFEKHDHLDALFPRLTKHLSSQKDQNEIRENHEQLRANLKAAGFELRER